MKREQILEVATEYFGRTATRRRSGRTSPSAVGIGSTALYHYFESKQHCLFEIMVEAVRTSASASSGSSAEHDDWTEALVAVLVDAFDLTEQNRSSASA